MKCASLVTVSLDRDVQAPPLSKRRDGLQSAIGGMERGEPRRVLDGRGRTTCAQENLEGGPSTPDRLGERSTQRLAEVRRRGSRAR